MSRIDQYCNCNNSMIRYGQSSVICDNCGKPPNRNGLDLEGLTDPPEKVTLLEKIEKQTLTLKGDISILKARGRSTEYSEGYLAALKWMEKKLI